MDLPKHCSPRGLDQDSRSVSIAIRLRRRPLQPQAEGGVVLPHHVLEEQRLGAVVVDDDVIVAVTVDIRRGESAPGSAREQASPPWAARIS